LNQAFVVLFLECLNNALFKTDPPGVLIPGGSTKLWSILQKENSGMIKTY